MGQQSIPNNKFQKKERLYLREELRQLFASRDSIVSYPFRVLYTWVPYQEDAPVKALISIPKKKLRRAVDRNRMKRLAKEAYRTNKHQIIKEVEDKTNKGTLLIGFVYLPSHRLNYQKVHGGMIDALETICRTVREHNKNSYK